MEDRPTVDLLQVPDQGGVVLAADEEAGLGVLHRHNGLDVVSAEIEKFG